MRNLKVSQFRQEFMEVLNDYIEYEGEEQITTDVRGGSLEPTER